MGLVAVHIGKKARGQSDTFKPSECMICQTRQTKLIHGQSNTSNEANAWLVRHVKTEQMYGQLDTSKPSQCMVSETRQNKGNA